MKTIFDCETVLGRCSDDWVETANAVAAAAPESGMLCVQSSAYLNGTKRMLRLEQRCFIRLGQEVAEQPWVKSEVRLETMLGTEQEMQAQIQQIHDAFVSRARTQIPERCFV